MSQENVEIVRAISEPWARGDFSSAKWAHPEIEYVIADGPAPGTWSGVSGMVRAWREILSAWDDWRGEAEGYRALDGGRVFVPFHFSARGKASGMEAGEVSTKGALLFQLRDGKVIKLVVYMDRADALEAVGLRE
jgi:ketosteroid isomerase-like protein